MKMVSYAGMHLERSPQPIGCPELDNPMYHVNRFKQSDEELKDNKRMHSSIEDLNMGESRQMVEDEDTFKGCSWEDKKTGAQEVDEALDEAYFPIRNKLINR